MGFFDRLFGKRQKMEKRNNINQVEDIQLKENKKFISFENGDAYRVIRDLNDEQRKRIEESTILLRTGKLYMHYWTDNLICIDENDQEWQNKVLFFWKAEEPFPKKSLPPHFESFKEKYFLFKGDTSAISLQVGQAMPWFGMPGLGEKHVCTINGEKISVPQLYELDFVEYIEKVELSDENFEILMDNENYFFLIDERLVTFQNGSFVINGQRVPISVAYSIGGIHIIKNTKLE